MLKVNDIPEQVIRDIAGAYHRRLESTGTEAQDEKERDFQRACYLRTALEWLAIWINQQAAPAAQVAQGVAGDVVLPRYRLIRIDTVSNTVRVENVETAGKETLSPLMPFDGTVSGLLAMLAAAKQQSGGAE